MDKWTLYVDTIHDSSILPTFHEYIRWLQKWGVILNGDGDFLRSEVCREKIIELLDKLSRAGYDDTKLAQAGVVRGVGCIGELLGDLRRKV